MAAKPDPMPKEVIEAVTKFAKHHNLNVVELLSPSVLKWDHIMGCYFFIHGGVYFGIETNGYLHS